MRDLLPSRATKAPGGPRVTQPSRDAHHPASSGRRGPINLGIFVRASTSQICQVENIMACVVPKQLPSCRLKLKVEGLPVADMLAALLGQDVPMGIQQKHITNNYSCSHLYHSVCCTAGVMVGSGGSSPFIICIPDSLSILVGIALSTYLVKQIAG